MVYQPGIQNNNSYRSSVSFAKNKDTKGKKKEKYVHDAYLMVEEREKHPLLLGAKIQADKLVKAFTVYPKKGLKGSKNANFYEFLTMGTVPYLAGSAMLIAVFNFAAKYFKTEAFTKSLKHGQKMALGVLFYGLAKTFSKKLIELPVKWKHGIDVNLPYKKEIKEIPEEDNKKNLIKYEYHKAYESVDFPRWDILYDNENFGKERNAYYDKIAKKMHLNTGDLTSSDQKVKPKIKEKLIQTKLFSTIASYLWAAVGVGVAMQEPFERISFIPERLKLGYGIKNPLQFVKLFGKRFVESCKSFVNNSNKSSAIAGRILLGTAIGVTLLGNFKTLFDFNKDKGSKNKAAVSLIDKTKEKVVC